jgi:phosphomannomutase/phosphoglucomutase
MMTSETILEVPTGPKQTPWKSGDLRGPFPDSISPVLFHSVGSAIGSLLPSGSRVLVAGDYRLSTPELKQALIEGLAGTGVSSLDGGLMPTPVAYFTADKLQADAVLIVTASHNPANHNGLKLMIGGVPTTPEQLSMIRGAVEAGSFRTGRGATERVDLVDAYQRQMIEGWSHLVPQRLPNLVIDAGNGAWSGLAPRIFRSLGFDVQCLSCEADGRFPDRPSDCSLTANLSNLRSAVAARENAIGLAWDGDGDRLALVDETGAHVSADEVSILLAKDLLENTTLRPMRVVVDIKLSDAVRRGVLALGGTPLLERTGHAFIRGRMIADDAELGLDACGHYFHKELHGGDDGLFSAMVILDLLQRSGQPLVELRRKLPPIFSTPEVRISADALPYDIATESLSEYFPDAGISRVDGFRFTLPEGSVLIRQSGTEAKVSLRIEGVDSEGLHSLIERCADALPTAALHLREYVGGQRKRVSILINSSPLQKGEHGNFECS